MSFWASSYSFQLESFTAAYRSLFKVVLLRVSFYDDCKETRAMFSQGLLLSIESFDDAKGELPARTSNRGPNFSMKIITVQEQ